MPVGVPGLRKLAFALAVLVGLGVTLSCYSSKGYTAPSRTKFRAFISNSLHPTGTGAHVPAIEIVNATTDVVVLSPIDLSALPDVSALDVSSDKQFTLAYSPSNDTFALVSNTTEQALINTASLPAPTKSFFIAVDNQHAYAAVPNAPVLGQPPGAVVRLDLAPGSTGSVSAILPVPHVQFVAQALTGNRILAFSDNSTDLCSDGSGAVTIIDATKIGTSVDPRILTQCGFDHPVGAAVRIVASSQAFILECGAECGTATTGAGITPLDLTTNTFGPKIPLPAATIGLVTGSTVYVAGTPPGNACDTTTQAPFCGVLSVVDVSTLTVTNSAPIVITDGYHSHMELTDDGHIYVGATGCDNVNTSTEIRGCISIFDTTAPATKPVFPPQTGDVTGIANIPGRSVAYVIHGGALTVFDTTTSAKLPNHQSAIVGQLVDVKAVDNPPN
jgi:hypothetical protein